MQGMLSSMNLIDAIGIVDVQITRGLNHDTGRLEIRIGSIHVLFLNREGHTTAKRRLHRRWLFLPFHAFRAKIIHQLQSLCFICPLIDPVQILLRGKGPTAIRTLLKFEFGDDMPPGIYFPFITPIFQFYGSGGADLGT